MNAEETLDVGTVCTIVGLQKQRTLNGTPCTVKGDDRNSKRVAVVLVQDGEQRNLLVKRENLHVTTANRNMASLTAEQQSILNGKDVLTKHLTKNTVKDVVEFQAKYDDLIRNRLEGAIACRNTGDFDRAEAKLITLLQEVEDLCGTTSVLVATVVKSYGMLRIHQQRWSEAESLFKRADELRPADCDGNAQGTHTIQFLFSAQLELRRIDAAEGTLHRLRALEIHIRPDEDASLAELEKQLEMAKSDPRRCCGCGVPLTAPLFCARCHVAVFCSRACQKTSWNIHRRTCQRSITGGRSTRSPQNTTATTETANGAASNFGSDPLTLAVLQNSAATDALSPESPTELGPVLISALADPLQTYFFCMNEAASSSLLDRDGGRRRVLATTGVLTCITVFAWSPPSASGRPGPCLGCHISLGALLRGLRACKLTRQDPDRALDPLLSELRRSFAKGPQRQVTLALVGGHRAMDVSEGLVEQFPDDREKWSFAWHVKAACRAALSRIADSVVWDTSLLMRFDGEFIRDRATEERVNAKHMNFIVAALDTATGHIFTQTKYADIDALLPGNVLRRQRRTYFPDLGAAFPNFKDPKIRLVSHSEEEC